MKPLPQLVLLAGLLHPASRVIAAQEAVGAAHHAHPPAQPSVALAIRAGERHLVLSAADLQALPSMGIPKRKRPIPALSSPMCLGRPASR